MVISSFISWDLCRILIVLKDNMAYMQRQHFDLKHLRPSPIKNNLTTLDLHMKNTNSETHYS